MTQFSSPLKQSLSHVLWLGGGTDAGKTTVCNLLAEKFDLSPYHYDGRDLIHHQCLAHTMPDVRASLALSSEERWIQPTPQELFERSIRSFQLRFPLVLNELLAMPKDRSIIAEGFGLTPELIAPLLSSPNRAIFFIPTEEFKWASMKERGKYARRLAWENGQRAIQNLFQRDMLISATIQKQGQEQGLLVHEVDGSLTPVETASLIAKHLRLNESF